MTNAAIRSDLLHKIEGLNAQQLKQFYGLIQNYLNGIESTEEWHSLTNLQKEKIETGIRQANEGMTRPVAKVTERLRRKHGLNG